LGVCARSEIQPSASVKRMNDEPDYCALTYGLSAGGLGGRGKGNGKGNLGTARPQEKSCGKGKELTVISRAEKILSAKKKGGRRGPTRGLTVKRATTNKKGGERCNREGGADATAELH